MLAKLYLASRISLSVPCHTIVLAQAVFSRVKILRCAAEMWQGVKKRQRGRPVVYQGDPDAPGLEPEQRRQLLRRISNRESARRIRHRHQEELASLCAKVRALQYPAQSF